MANPRSIAALVQAYYPEYYSLHTYPAAQCAPIFRADGPWGVLGNFGSTPLTVEGLTFANSEQLFQMMKFRDPEPLLDLYHARGMTIKMKTKHWEPTHRRQDWGAMLIDAMKFCLTLKHEQCPAFRQELERSRGLYIVEDQTSKPKKTADTWGVKLQGDTYEGSNLLGRLLMELRDQGSLSYRLPSDALAFIATVKANLAPASLP